MVWIYSILYTIPLLTFLTCGAAINTCVRVSLPSSALLTMGDIPRSEDSPDVNALARQLSRKSAVVHISTHIVKKKKTSFHISLIEISIIVLSNFCQSDGNKFMSH